MKSRLLPIFCAGAVLFSLTPFAHARSPKEPVAVVADVLVVRPLTFAATIVGSALFIVSLPVAATSKSIKPTAETLVGKPARATFTRQVGDMDSLGE